MKISKTFSIESGVFDSFVRVCEEKRLNKNAVISVLINDWLKDTQEIKMVHCSVCNATYSGKLSDCPQCKLTKKRESDRAKLEELKARKPKMEKWVKEGKAQQNELDKIDLEIQEVEDRLKVD